MYTMRFHGGDELARRLTALPGALSRAVVVRALTAGAEPIRAMAAQRAHRRREPKPWGHLADNIVISSSSRIGSPAGGRWRLRDDTEHAVAVGPRLGFFHGLFEEYGTVFHAAHPFLRPAFDQGAVPALGIIGRELWIALRRALPHSFPPAAGWGGGLR